MLGLQKRRNKQLWEACEKGDLDSVRRLLAKGADPDHSERYYETMLTMSIDKGNLEIFKALLDAGADVNGKADSSHQPLQKAAERKNTEMFRLLLEYGADPDLQGWGKKTPLHQAAWYNAPEIVRLLLDSEKCPGVDINALDSDGYTPLMRALGEKKRAEAAHTLLDHKAGLDHRSEKEGLTALIMAVKSGQVDLALKMIWLGADTTQADASGDTVLIYAARSGYDAVIDAIIEEAGNAGLDHANEAGQTALQIAAGRGHKKVVKKLLTSGADPDIADAEGVTPMLAAVKAGMTTSVKFLLDHGADVERADKKGNTPLILACDKYKGRKLVETLLDAGADPNTANEKGVTPLLQAASHGYGDYDEIGRLLLERGADPDAVKSFGDAFFSAQYVDTYERWRREFKQEQQERSKSGYVVEDENTVVRRQELMGGELILTRVFNFKSSEVITVTNDNGNRSTDVKNFSEVEDRREIEEARAALNPQQTARNVTKTKTAIDIRLK